QRTPECAAVFGLPPFGAGVDLPGPLLLLVPLLVSPGHRLGDFGERHHSPLLFLLTTKSPSPSPSSRSLSPAEVIPRRRDFAARALCAHCRIVYASISSSGATRGARWGRRSAK